MSSLGLAILLEHKEYDNVVLVGLCLQFIGLQDVWLYVEQVSKVFSRDVKILIQQGFCGNRECTTSLEIAVCESTKQACLL